MPSTPFLTGLVLPARANPRAVTLALETLHDIFTMDGGNGARTWLAFSMPQARKELSGYLKGTESGIDIFGSYCRLLEEASLLHEARTKREAVRKVIDSLP